MKGEMYKQRILVKQSRWKINLLVLGPKTPNCFLKEEIESDFSTVLFEGSSLGWKYKSELENYALARTKSSRALSTFSFLLLNTCLQTLDHYLLNI